MSMKNHVSTFFSAITLALVACLYSGCSLLDKADDISFDTVLEAYFYISEDDEGTNVSYFDFIEVDAEQDSDVKKYANKIKKFTVKKVQYQVLNYSGPFECNFSNGQMIFSDSPTTPGSQAATLPLLDIPAASASATIFDLTVNSTVVNQIQTFLKNNRALYVYVTGTLSETPVYFTVRVMVDVTIEADAL